MIKFSFIVLILSLVQVDIVKYTVYLISISTILLILNSRYKNIQVAAICYFESFKFRGYVCSVCGKPYNSCEHSMDYNYTLVRLC
jgi:hypothetical protein